MVGRGRNWAIAFSVAAAVWSAADAARAQGKNDERPRGEAREVADTRAGWPRVHIPDPVAAMALRSALDRAWSSLRELNCQRVLRAFADRTGQSLDGRLAALGVGVQEHLTRIVFIDETRNRYCVTGVVAFTQPGSYVVRLCVDEFKRTWQQDPRHTIAALIHEMLHTLGLGENPPTSNEITKTVREMCQAR